MDWFERLTGFIESDYATTRTRLEVVGTELRSKINGGAFGIGELELVALQTLRERATSRGGPAGRLIFRNIRGDARALHRSSEFSGAMFQVASQFNLLEMVSPDVVPEKGVTRYQYDKTQGPACAIAAGAGTIFRNYFVPIDGEQGQTSQRQLDGLRDLGSELAGALGRQLGSLWKMSNGYALCTSDGLDAIAGYLRTASSEELDRLRGLLRVGVQSDVEITDGTLPTRQFVTQAFCSALPVAYTSLSSKRWEPFARLVLDAAYEATLWAGVLNARRGVSNIVLLTRLGGGAFGNDDGWIDTAISRALTKVRDFALDVRLVSFGAIPTSMLSLEAAPR